MVCPDNYFKQVNYRKPAMYVHSYNLNVACTATLMYVYVVSAGASCIYFVASEIESH